MNINSAYYQDSPRTYVGAGTLLAGEADVAYPYGTTLSDEDIESIIGDVLADGSLPTDEAAMYMVLTSKDVALRSGFCDDYCGWHSFAQLVGKNIRFGFVGNGERCPNSCAGLTQETAPNGNLGADAMASILMHEIVEVLTDPHFDA
jgi:hypothetical protein